MKKSHFRQMRVRRFGPWGTFAALFLGTSLSLAQTEEADEDQNPGEDPKAQDEPSQSESEPAETDASEDDTADDDTADEDTPGAEATEADTTGADTGSADEESTPQTRGGSPAAARPAEADPSGARSEVTQAADPGPVGTSGDLSEGLDDVSLVDLLQLDLRVATTKTNTTVQASPAAVTVITREQIERYGYRSVQDALRDVVGTYAVDDHITPNLGMRGIPGAAYEGSGAVKVMIDGVAVSFRTTGENWLGPALVPMASVERIEIVKGPTSSLYGADAFLGVINVITKKNAMKSWGEASATGMMTYQGKPGAHVEGAGEIVLRPFRISVAGQFDQEDRSGLFMPESSPAPRFADTATDRSRGQILRDGVATVGLHYNPTRQTSVSLVGRYARHSVAAEFAPWLQFTNVPGQDDGTWSSLQQGSVTLKAGSSFTRTFSLEGTATAFFGGTLPGDQIETGDSLARVHRNLSYYGGEGIIEAVWQPVDPLRVVLGVEGSADREHLGAPVYRSRQDGSDLPDVGLSEDFETTLFNVAGRAQVTWEIIKDYLVPTAGIRFDHNTVYGDKLSGRAAIVSRLFDGMYVKASYGNAFKAPTPLLLYGRPLTVGDVIGSTELGAQELRTAEFTADYRQKSLFDVELTVSRWDLLDRAVFRPEQINLVARNAADAQGWTVELQAKSRFSDFVGGSLGGEWVRVERESGEIGYRGELFGNSPAIYPSVIGRARVWTHPKGWPVEIWAATNVVGPRKASDSNTLEAADRYTLPTYATLDAGIRTMDLELWGERQTEFSLRGQNITNTAGDQPGFFGIDYPAAPPKVLLEVRQEL